MNDDWSAFGSNEKTKSKWFDYFINHQIQEVLRFEDYIKSTHRWSMILARDDDNIEHQFEKMQMPGLFLSN